MAYSVKSKKSGKTYFLHTKEVTLAGNRKQQIFYFDLYKFYLDVNCSITNYLKFCFK